MLTVAKNPKRFMPCESKPNTAMGVLAEASIDGRLDCTGKA
jgi:hypothetical protein